MTVEEPKVVDVGGKIVGVRGERVWIDNTPPPISRLYGILIQTYLDDHPPTHVHAGHGELEATIGPTLEGGARIPSRSRGRALP